MIIFLIDPTTTKASRTSSMIFFTLDFKEKKRIERERSKLLMYILSFYNFSLLFLKFDIKIMQEIKK